MKFVDFANRRLTRIHFPTIDSTQKYVLKEGLELAKKHEIVSGNWLMISADEQTEGIGQRRLGTDEHKKWLSPLNMSTSASILFPLPKTSAHHLYHMAQCSALSVCRTIEDLMLKRNVDIQKLNCQLKWINDTLIQNRKVSGLICHCIGDLDESNMGVVVGIGMNVDEDPSLSNIDQPTWTLMGALRELSPADSEPITTEEVYESLARNFYDSMSKVLAYPETNLDGVASFKASGMLDEVNRRLAFRNEEVRIVEDGNNFFGVLQGLNDKGEAHLQMKNGDTKTFSHGQLFGGKRMLESVA
eukprot:GDKJ01057559.1.p1 GENE.GDKJ01057559.1~~GDKJ01057559.1.p1  ORF type:complete len:301 (-),score=67.76 GDKJ01057559.1:160-1062(-)